MTTLDHIRQGQQMMILEIPDTCPVKAMLRDFGILQGSALRCQYFSPGRELVVLEWEGTVLALRLRELKDITVKELA